jgi:hypothetical protein
MSTITTLKPTDKTTQKIALGEAIPITGSLVSGTLDDLNIKNFGHQMFQSVYDYPYLSSSANHVFDITCGVKSGAYDSAAPLGASVDQNQKKHAIYSQMSQMLVGFDATASQIPFRPTASYEETKDPITGPMFLNFSRLLTKDEIQKGSFRLQFGTGAFTGPAGFGTFDGPPGDAIITIGDFGATSSYNDTNSPVGEYAVLRSGSADGVPVGTIYYQAGVVVLDVSQSLFISKASGSFISQSAIATPHWDYDKSVQSGTIQQMADALRQRIYNIEFNNTTELHSTIYFCRANHHQYNYSSNPTYLSASQIRVKGSGQAAKATNMPHSYITTVGLYGPDGACLATAKPSEPLHKTPNNELTVRVRLDY